MNSENITTQKRISKLNARLSAALLFLAAVISLILCIHAYFKGSFLDTGSAFSPELVNDMRMIIKVAVFIVIPALSILLIFSSRLIWRLSKELNNDR